MPNEVQGDTLLDGIISVFVLACRERRYTSGQPLPISTSDITSVLSVRPLDVPRWLLDDIIFEIDSLELSEIAKLQKAR